MTLEDWFDFMHQLLIGFGLDFAENSVSNPKPRFVVESMSRILVMLFARRGDVLARFA